MLHSLTKKKKKNSNRYLEKISSVLSFLILVYLHGQVAMKELVRETIQMVLVVELDMEEEEVLAILTGG